VGLLIVVHAWLGPVSTLIRTYAGDADHSPRYQELRAQAVFMAIRDLVFERLPVTVIGWNKRLHGHRRRTQL